MRLNDYLARKGESYRRFADRAGIDPQTVANVILGERACRIDIAARIVEASRKAPAGRGGVVRFEDLVPPGALD